MEPILRRQPRGLVLPHPAVPAPVFSCPQTDAAPARELRVVRFAGPGPRTRSEPLPVCPITQQTAAQLRAEGQRVFYSFVDNGSLYARDALKQWLQIDSRSPLSRRDMAADREALGLVHPTFQPGTPDPFERQHPPWLSHSTRRTPVYRAPRLLWPRVEGMLERLYWSVIAGMVGGVGGGTSGAIGGGFLSLRAAVRPQQTARATALGHAIVMGAVVLLQPLERPKGRVVLSAFVLLPAASACLGAAILNRTHPETTTTIGHQAAAGAIGSVFVPVALLALLLPYALVFG